LEAGSNHFNPPFGSWDEGLIARISLQVDSEIRSFHEQLKSLIKLVHFLSFASGGLTQHFDAIGNGNQPRSRLTTGSA
jgi:hypothetical protein